MPIAPTLEHYLVDRDTMLERIDAIDPMAYDRERNYLDGAVTWLSPFLTHGVIDTTTVAERVLARHDRKRCYKLLFELAWREYFHRLWQAHGDDIFTDLREPQDGVESETPPAALLDAATGIDTIDRCLEHLFEHGTLHNHARMWTAAIACNLAHTYWHEPARWLYHHLIDGDLASNTLSWQWVAGTASSKRYVANQDNVNKYGAGRQHDTWLDVPYSDFDGHFPTPDIMQARRDTDLPSEPPGEPVSALSGDDTVALHSLWHLDPEWRRDVETHILFIDRSLDVAWPFSPKRWTLVQHWADRCGARLVCGELGELVDALTGRDVLRVEYPACDDWPGEVEPRRWLYPSPEDDMRSFSKYWKQVRGSVGL